MFPFDDFVMKIPDKANSFQRQANDSAHFSCNQLIYLPNKVISVSNFKCGFLDIISS